MDFGKPGAGQSRQSDQGSAARCRTCSHCAGAHACGVLTETEIARVAWAGSERAWAICPAISLLLAVLPVAGESAQINVQTERHGDSFEVDATAEIDAGVAEAWKVLTDYDRLAEFIPGVQESRVVSRDGTKVVVEQRGEARLLFFVFPMQVRLAIEEFPYDHIVSNAISGNFKELHGIYYLQAHPGGLSLRYKGTLTPNFSVPPLIGTLLMRNSVEKRFAAMVHEIEKTRQREPAPAVR